MSGSGHGFGSDPRGQQAVADRFAREYGPPPDEGRSNGHGVRARAVYDVPDETIIESIRASRQGEKFGSLYDQGIHPEGKEDSEADYSLACVLRYWTQDPDQVERIMRRSRLWRTRWDEHHGGDRTRLRYTVERAVNPPGGRDYDTHDWGDEFLAPHEEGVGSGGREKGIPADYRGRFVRPAEIMATANVADPWVCQPWLARGGITDLAGTAKLSGKTTFMLHMAAAILRGGWFMGHRCQRSPVVYLSEQGNNIEKVLREAEVTEQPNLHIMLRHLGHGLTWTQIMEVAILMCEDVGAAVLMVDTLNRFAGLVGEQENQAGPVAGAMTPLLDAAREKGLAVVVSRHANHEGRGRGSTQFLHDVDIVLTMRQPDGSLPPNVRRLEAHGRYDNIPPVTNVALEEGRYVDLGASARVRRDQAKAAIREFISERGRDEREWPTKAEIVAHVEGPSVKKSTTVDRALDELADDGETVRVGKGVKGDPYRHGFILPTDEGQSPSGGEKATEAQQPPQGTSHDLNRATAEDQVADLDGVGDEGVAEI